MRLVLCGPVIFGMSAILLSGCSWLGYDNSAYYGGGPSQANGGAYYGNGSQAYGAQSANTQYTANAQNAGYGMQAVGACQITSPMQRIPQGCAQEDVSLAVGNGQQGGAQYGQGQQAQYTSGGYGSHTGSVRTSTQYQTPAQKTRRPKLRGSLGLEIDHSVSGTLYEPSLNGNFAAYSSTPFWPADGVTYGTPADGRVDTFNNFTTVAEEVRAKTISFDDAYNAPLRLTGGLEYIFNDHNTVFANAGYTRAEGAKAGSAEIIETLQSDLTTTYYDSAQDVTGVFTSVGEQRYGVPVAKFTYDFNDLERIDLEVGGRHYFNPMFKQSFSRALTPYVSASGGASYYSEISVVDGQQQRRLRPAFLGVDDPQGDYFTVAGGSVTTVSDSQWVPYGALKGGVEWQMTPKTALAFEVGLKYEGARDFTGGTKGEALISVPVAIRGSYNF